MVREKHPGVYDDMDDAALEAAIVAKFPGVYDDLVSKPTPVTPEPPPLHPYARITEGLKGAAKEVGARAVNLGRIVHQIPGVSRVLGDIPDDAESTLGLTPSNPEQEIGGKVEQIAEFMIPAAAAERTALAVASKVAPLLGRAAPVASRAALQGGTSAGVATAQNGDPLSAGVMGAAVPAAGVVANAASRGLRSGAEGLVRSAIKPTVTAMKRIAGASKEGLDAKAEGLVRFIIDNRLTTPNRALNLVTESERELQRILSVKNAPTDAPQRAARYLATLERNAAKQGLAADDVAQLRNAAAEMLEGGMGKDVVTMVPKPHPTLVQPNGQPFMVMTPQTSRALRTDVMADEALESARASSKWSTRKQWGEQKGTRMEAGKAVERAQRDAVKDAVPETRAVLATQGKALQTKDILDRMKFREGNRDAVSLPAHVVAAGEMASGRVPLMAFAANWLRNNQMKAGVGADALSKAIQRNDVRAVSEMLSRFGVAVGASPSRP